MAARFRTTGTDSSRRGSDSVGAARHARATQPAAHRAHMDHEQAARGGSFARAQRSTASAHRFAQMGGSPAMGPGPEVPAGGSDDTPRPIGVDPQVTGSFRTLGHGQGAVLSTRESAQRAADAARAAQRQAGPVRISSRHRPSSLPRRRAQQRLDPRVVAGIVGAACVVAIVLFVALRGVVDEVVPAPEPQTQAQTAVGQGVSLGGAMLSVRESDEGQQLVRTAQDGTQTVLATLSGTPVSIAQSGQAIYIAENLPDGTWDVLSYVVADGSEPTQLLGDDGNPVRGTGTLVSSEIDGSTLVLVDGSGAKTTVSLA